MIASTITFLIIFFICVVCGVSVGDEYTFVISIGAGILLGVTGFLIVADGVYTASNPKEREKQRRRKQAQDSYDNYWGTIDWNDR